MASPTGYYVFRSAVGKIDLDLPFMKNPNISGIVLRDTWGSCEATQGTFSWTRLDGACKKVAAAGKNFMIEVLAGPKSPSWSGGMNAQYTNTFRAFYENMVAAFGAKFSAYPNLTAVHCTLPSTGSAEFSNPPAALLKTGWQTKALESNKRALVALGAAFPSQTIVVNLHNPTGARDGFVTAQIKQGKQLLGERFGVQQNAWKATSQVTYNLYQECKKHGEAGYPMGFEAITESDDPRFQGDFVDGLPFAKVAGAQYLIIYYRDDQYCKSPWSI